MSSNAAAHTTPSITARPSAEEKRAFAVLAARRGISGSKLALICVRALLRDNPPDGIAFSAPAPVHDRGTDRITIRLRPGDLRAITQRAAARRIKPSTYIAALVRGHVVCNPPLATAELEALKQAIIVLARCGTLAARSLRGAQLGTAETADLRRALSEMKPAVHALEERMHDLVYESLRSWESSYE